MSDDLVDLLIKLRPVVHYDRDEPFFADHAESLINNAYDGGPCLPYGTRLMRADGEEVIAAVDHEDPNRRLDLGYLRSGDYPCGDHVNDDDYLDAGPEWVADARRAHPSSGVADRAYGRVADSRDGHWLQYWFFYFASTKGIPSVQSATGLLGTGLHGGDWEMIQLHVRPGESTPDRVTYAAHDYAYAVELDEVNWLDGAPRVYVGVGSHASYPKPGRWRSQGAPGAGWLKFLDDRCAPVDSDGRRVELEVLSSDGMEPSWLQWPGRWGLHGPQSPAQQDQWTSPDKLHEDGHRVSDGLRSPQTALAEAAVAAPEAITVHVSRQGSRRVIEFDLPDDVEGDWAGLLTLVLDPDGAERPTPFQYDVTEPGDQLPG